VSIAKSHKMFALTVTLMTILAASLLCSFSVFMASAQTTPTITVGANTGYTNTTVVTLNVAAVNATQMQFSNDGSTWSSWEPYATTKTWNLADGDGAKTVYAQFQDNANQTTATSATVVLDTVAPVPYPYYGWLSVSDRIIGFDGSGSVDASPIRFLWSFGDGETAIGISANHTYAAVGNYSAYLTVTDIAGNAATQPFTVYVLDPSAFVTPTPPPPTQHPPTATPITTPQTSTQPTAAPGVSFSAGWIVVIGAAVLLVVVVILLIFVLRRKPSNTPKPA
jgi:hypothetical protein